MYQKIAFLTTIFAFIFNNIANPITIDVSNYNVNTSTYEDYSKISQKYMIQIGYGKKHIDINEAIKDKASKDFIQVSHIYNTMVENEINKGINPLNYGNWCGPGHSGPGNPIDKLDTACRSHDRCYGRHGYGNKQCDLDFVRSMRKMLPSLSGYAKAYATAAIAFFAAGLKNNGY